MSKQTIAEAGVLLSQVERRDSCRIDGPVARGAAEGNARVIAQVIGWQHARAGRPAHESSYGCSVSRIKLADASKCLNYSWPGHGKARRVAVNALPARCRKHAGTAKTVPPYQRKHPKTGEAQVQHMPVKLAKCPERSQPFVQSCASRIQAKDYGAPS